MISRQIKDGCDPPPPAFHRYASFNDRTALHNNLLNLQR